MNPNSEKQTYTTTTPRLSAASAASAASTAPVEEPQQIQITRDDYEKTQEQTIRISTKCRYGLMVFQNNRWMGYAGSFEYIHGLVDALWNIVNDDCLPSFITVKMVENEQENGGKDVFEKVIHQAKVPKKMLERIGLVYTDEQSRIISGLIFISDCELPIDLSWSGIF